MNHRAALSVGAVLLWLLGTMLLHAGPPAGADWDQESAARYLDRRMDLWWTQAKTLRTGDGEIKCLSCHTAIPYAWARAALRHAQGAVQPTPHEQRIVELASRRVQYASGDQPYYDNSEAKMRESRGVEAVLNAVVLTSRERDQRAGEPGAATTAALSRLWQVQRGDGAWDWLDF
jgi:squalene-hopene/tetraprenyl-beta-curcumene cyclase